MSRIKLSLQDFNSDMPDREGNPALWYCGIMNEDPELSSAMAHIPVDRFDESAIAGPHANVLGPVQQLQDQQVEEFLRERNAAAREAARARREV